jgi:hypothetical protein
MGTEDAAVASVEETEMTDPSPRKILPDRTIHLSYDMPTTYEAASITDFSCARLGEPGQKFRGFAMPTVYRAPEVIAEME